MAPLRPHSPGSAAAHLLLALLPLAMGGAALIWPVVPLWVAMLLLVTGAALLVWRLLRGQRALDVCAQLGHQIRPPRANLSPAAATQPTTQPSTLQTTQPTTQPTTQSTGQPLWQSAAAHPGHLRLMIDQDDRITWASDNVHTLLGVTPSQLLGQHFTTLLPPADQQRWREVTSTLRGGVAPTTHPFGRLRMLRMDQSSGAQPAASAASEFPAAAASATADAVHAQLHPQLLYLDAQLTWLAEPDQSPQVMINAIDISAHEGLQRRLSRTESRFSFLFHASPDAIVLVRAHDRVVLDFNRAFTSLFGAAREQTVGQCLDELDLWEQPNELDAFMDGVNAQVGMIEQTATLARHPHRQSMDARVSACFTDADGELAVLLIIRDITASRETEAALSEVEEKFALVFNAAPDGIVITRLRDRVVLDINDYLCRNLGYSREDVIGHSLDNLDLFADLDVARRSAQLLERFGSYRDIELVLKAKSGARLHTFASASSLDIGGERCVVTMAKDIQALHHAELALRQSEARFRGAFEDAPMGIALVNRDLTLQDGNHWLANMMGIARAALPDCKITDLLVAEERAGLEHALQQLLGADHQSLHRELCIRRADGDVRFATLHAVVQQDNDGAPDYFIIQLVDVTDIKRSQEQMERLAFYDPLTNLANRRLFMDRLEQTMQQAARSGRSAALFYLDLDQFKKINDTLGHDVGDELLKTVAERLRHCVRREDTVGRPGGDEFNIVLHEVRDADAAAHVAEHVLSILREPAFIDGRRVDITTSIGIAMIPDDGADANSLVQRADQAMYRAKQQGRNTYRFYGDAVNARAADRVNFENALERALIRDELTLFLQPIVRLDDHSLYGVEALLRWQHPQRGLLEPALFLEVSEHAGLLRALDMWSLRRACRQLQAMDQAGLNVPAIAVNIANRHISDPGLPRTISDLLAESGIAPSRLQIEISERMLAREPETAHTWLEGLRNHGLTITIDDFGAVTGSLNAISRLPIQRVKLDTTIIHRLTSSREAAIMVDTVVAVCAGLGRDVIAEGVETNEQRERLLRAGCKLAQGFLLGMPQTSADLMVALGHRPQPQTAAAPSQDIRQPSASAR